MGFLDRFKPQPRWKHPDSAVRAAAVEALPEDEQDLIRSIALEDAEPGVRRVALARIADAATLARIAREDPDETVRADARELVLGLAQDTRDADEALQALAGLNDSRELAIVARTAELEAAAHAALDRLQEPKVVAVVARQAGHAAVRAAALTRLSDPADLVAVAVKSEHKDVGLAALERVTDRDALNLIAARARNKAVSRRARALLRTAEEAERIPQRLAVRRMQVVEAMEALLQSTDLSQAAGRAESAAADWDEVATGADPAIAERFAAARARVQELLSKGEAERAEHEARARAVAAETEQAASTRSSLCEKVEALAGDGAASGLDEARTIWVALMPWPEPVRGSARARQMDERFARACGACEQRVAAYAQLAERRAEIAQLAAKAEAAVALEDLAAARAAFAPIRQAWTRAATGLPHEEAQAERLSAADAALVARDGAAREARAREAREHAARVEQLCKHVDALLAQPELALKDAERAVRDMRTALDHPGAFPSKQDHDRALERLRTLHGTLFARVQELRDSDEWRRWANASVQEELCRKAEALKDIQDAAEAAKQLRDLQQQWKKVGASPRERGAELWQRFRTACDETRMRCDAYFGEQRAAEQGSLEKKIALSVRAEALAESTDWIRTAEELKALQAEWQQVGPVPHDQAKAVWMRFRTACDTFFTRRKDDLAQRKQVWSENLHRKEAICARVETLAASTEWEAAASEIKALQAEWKAIGPVRRTKSEALWARFRAACDTFFERYKQRDQLDLAQFVTAREDLCAELERLVPLEGTPAPVADDAVAARALEVWQRWQQAARLPRQVLEPLEERFETALRRVLEAHPDRFRGSRLDLEANLNRMEQLVTQVESLVSGRVTMNDLASAPPQALAALLKDALASNTIGGRVDDEARRRAAAGTVRDAQNEWRRLGPVPGERARGLAGRFQRACRRFFEQGAGTASGALTNR